MPASPHNLFEEILLEIKDEAPIAVAPELTLDREGVKKWGTAYIAETLKPCVEKTLTEQSTVKIVGYDAGYLQKENETWHSTLESWLDRGCDITYLLLNPEIDAGVRRKFEHLATADHPGRFVLKVASKEAPSGTDDSALLGKWRTFHFCLFENPRQLWVESDHPIGKHTAHDCYYAPPAVAETMADYRILDSQFDRIVSRYAVQTIPKKD